VRELSREDVEKDVTFVGFIIISCPLKPDSKAVVREIRDASHHVSLSIFHHHLSSSHPASSASMTDSELQCGCVLHIAHISSSSFCLLLVVRVSCVSVNLLLMVRVSCVSVNLLLMVRVSCVSVNLLLLGDRKVKQTHSLSPEIFISSKSLYCKHSTRQKRSSRVRQ